MKVSVQSMPLNLDIFIVIPIITNNSLMIYQHKPYRKYDIGEILSNNTFNWTVIFIGQNSTACCVI